MLPAADSRVDQKTVQHAPCGVPLSCGLHNDIAITESRSERPTVVLQLSAEMRYQLCWTHRRLEARGGLAIVASTTRPSRTSLRIRGNAKRRQLDLAWRNAAPRSGPMLAVAERVSVITIVGKLDE